MGTIVDVLLRRDAIARAFGDDRSIKGFERLQEIVAGAPDLITQAQTTATDAQTKTNALKASVQFVVMSATGLTAAERVLTAGTGLGLTDGGAGGNATLALANTAVAAGAYGDATHVGTFTVDAQGRLTGAASVAITFPAGGATAFTGLSDVPASYSGQALKAVRVNAGATALEFYTPSTGSGDLISTNNLSDVANAGTARTNLGLAIGSNVQAYSANLTTYAGIAPSANVQSILGAANYAAVKTLLALTIGTDVQAYSANLTTYAGIAPSANVQTLLGAASFSAFRTSLSLVPGTDVQVYSANLAALAALSTTGKLYYLSAANTWTAVTIGTGISFSGGTLAATGAGSGTSTNTGLGAVVYFASNLAAGATGNVTIAFDTSLYNDTVDPGDGGGVQRFWLGANKTASVASTTLETLTITAHGLTTGEGPFFFTTTTTLPGGMSTATKYWAIVVDANTISLATSRANALAATKVDITSSGTGTHTLNTGPFLIVPKGVSRIQVGASIADTGSAIAVNLLVLKNGSSSYAGILRQDTSTPATQGGNAAGPPIPVSEGDYLEMQFNVFSADTLVALTTWFSILAWK